MDNSDYIPSADLELQLLHWSDAKPLAAQIRRTVFIEEQQVPESEEWDEEDDSSLHIVVIKGGDAVATARLTQEGEIGRMAVLKQHRQQGIASMMLNKLIEVAKQLKHQQITLWSQTYAQGFYKKHGFVAHGEEFLDAGIPHIEMHMDGNIPIDEEKKSLLGKTL